MPQSYKREQKIWCTARQRVRTAMSISLWKILKTSLRDALDPSSCIWNHMHGDSLEELTVEAQEKHRIIKLWICQNHAQNKRKHRMIYTFVWDSHVRVGTLAGNEESLSYGTLFLHGFDLVQFFLRDKTQPTWTTPLTYVQIQRNAWNILTWSVSTSQKTNIWYVTIVFIVTGI